MTGRALKRSSLKPPFPPGEDGIHSMRRALVRRQVAERAIVRTADRRELAGWALNLSGGGVRVILEERVGLGEAVDVQVGSPEEGAARFPDGNAMPMRRGRVVWLQEEEDGVVAGIEFVGASGVHFVAHGAEGAGDERR